MSHRLSAKNATSSPKGAGTLPEAWSDRPFLLWLAFFTLCFAVTAFYTTPLVSWARRDSGVFLSGAKALLGGQRLYLDYWDHKPPLIYLVNALGLRLDVVWGVWILENLALYVSFVLLFLAIRRWGRGYMVFPFLLLFLARDPAFYEGGNLPEVWVLVFWMNALALLCRPLDRWGLALLGLLTVLSFATKVNCVSLFVALFLVGAWRCFRQRQSFRVLSEYAGWVVFWGAMGVGFLAFQGLLSGFYDAVLVFNARYMREPHYPLWSSSFWVFPVKAWMMVLVALSAVGIGLSRRPWVEGFELRDEKVFWLLFLLLEVVSFATTGRYYGHYFIPFCVIAAYGLSNLADHLGLLGTRAQGGVTSRAWLFVILLPLILGHGSALKDQVRQFRVGRWPEEERYVRLSSYLSTRSLGGCYVWGEEAKAYWVGNLHRLGRYPYMTPLVTEGYVRREEAKREYERIFSTPAPVLIDFTPPGSDYHLAYPARESDPYFLGLLKGSLPRCRRVDRNEDFVVYYF